MLFYKKNKVALFYLEFEINFKKIVKSRLLFFLDRFLIFIKIKRYKILTID